MELSFQRQKEAFTEADIAMMIRLVVYLVIVSRVHRAQMAKKLMIPT